MLLHGFLGSRRNLGALIRRWKARDPSVDLVALDLPGHGDASPLPPGGLGPMTAAVLAELDARGLKTPRIVGHSLGGRVALMTRRLRPAARAPVTLLDIAPGPITRRSRELAGVPAALLSAPATSPTREQMRAHLGALSDPIADWLLMNLAWKGDRFEWRIDRARLVAFDREAAQDDLLGHDRRERHLHPGRRLALRLGRRCASFRGPGRPRDHDPGRGPLRPCGCDRGGSRSPLGPVEWSPCARSSRRRSCSPSCRRAPLPRSSAATARRSASSR